MAGVDVEEAIRIARDELVAPFEGYHRKLPDGGCCAYPDPASGGEPWTIGFGSTGADIHPDTIWTRQQAEERLSAELRSTVRYVLHYFSSQTTLTERRLAGLISFVYNVGSGNFRVSSVRRYASMNEWSKASDSLLLWNKASGKVMRGLTIRRQAEARYLV